MTDTLLLYAPFKELREVAQSPRYYWDNSQRGSDEFVIIQRTVSGAGMFRFEGRTYPVPEGYAFIALIPEPSVYYYPREATEPWEFTWLNFHGPLAYALFRDFRKTYGPVLPIPLRSKAGALFHRLSSGRERISDPITNSITCYTLLMEWMRQLTLPLQQEQSAVEIAVNLCATRFKEPLGVKELAEATGLSREHFSRLFRQRMGVSPARYLRDLRIRAALEMMENGTTQARELAIRCGFPSVRSFRMAMQGFGEDAT